MSPCASFFFVFVGRPFLPLFLTAYAAFSMVDCFYVRMSFIRLVFACVCVHFSSPFCCTFLPASRKSRFFTGFYHRAHRFPICVGPLLHTVDMPQSQEVASVSGAASVHFDSNRPTSQETNWDPRAFANGSYSISGIVPPLEKSCSGVQYNHR